MTQEEFSLQYLRNLNPQQKEAVLAVDGAILLLAVPGSGKTTVLVTRLGYMILCRGISPEQILTMTYTRDATKEMALRFQKLFGCHCSTPLNFSTINSLSNQIIFYYSQWKNRQWAYILPDSKEIIRIVRQIYQSLNGDFPTDSTVSDVLRAIAYIKNQMLTPEEIKKLDLGIGKLPQIYKLYEKTMHDSGFMDFDDQMVFAHRILTLNPEVLAAFQERYPYICVDESQDTSRIQHAIIRLLTKKNLFMVGDEDQSIYGFRAAYPEALLNFENDYADTKVLLMEFNYRSSQQIVDAANGFIARNTARRPKESKATQGSGSPIHIVRGTDRKTQLDYILEVAANSPQDTAVLFRNNDSAIPLVDLLDRKHIPFRFRGSDDKFFTHKVVADMVDMLCFAQNPRDAERFMRIYYKFGGGISKEAAEAACMMSTQSGKSIPEELSRVPGLSARGLETARDLVLMLPTIPSGTAEYALNCLWNTLKYGAYAADRGMDSGKLDILKLLASQVRSPGELLARMDTLRDMIQHPLPGPECSLTISTIHSSKGLEYRQVILLDVFDGVLPGITKADVTCDDDRKAYEEERRLCYVGMTRAKEELTLFLLRSHPSEFVSEIIGNLPKIACEEQDVFSSLFKDLRGKSYTHAEYGTGRVIAQDNDTLLLEFTNGKKLRMSLAEMLKNRAVTYEPAKPAPVSPGSGILLSPEAITPGTRVNHTTFGPGTVLTVRSGIATISFGKNFGQRTILLKSAIKKGILHT